MQPEGNGGDQRQIYQSLTNYLKRPHQIMVTYQINGMFLCLRNGFNHPSISIVNKFTVSPSGGIYYICLVTCVFFVKFALACHSSSAVHKTKHI